MCWPWPSDDVGNPYNYSHYSCYSCYSCPQRTNGIRSQSHQASNRPILASVLVYFSALKGSRLTTIASCALRTTTQCEGVSGELLISLCGAKGGT